MNPQFLQNSLYLPVGLLQRGHIFCSSQKYRDMSLSTTKKESDKGSKIHQKGSTRRDKITHIKVIKMKKKPNTRNLPFFCVRELPELIRLQSF